MTLDRIKTVVGLLGGSVEVDRIGDDVTIEVIAPDGKQWVSGQCQVMVEIYYTHVTGDRVRAYKSILERVGFGFEDLNTELNRV